MNDKKILLAQRSELKKERDVLKEIVSRHQKELSSICKEIDDISDKIDYMAVQPSISDHAIIRYCEREIGFNFDEIREELLSEKRIDLINFGADAIKTEHGKFVVRDKCMVTFVPNKD